MQKARIFLPFTLALSRTDIPLGLEMQFCASAPCLWNKEESQRVSTLWVHWEDRFSLGFEIHIYCGN